MRARVPSFETHELRRPLIEERSLIKLRCMRRTLHILPLNLAPVAHAATLDQRAGACRASLRRLGHSERALGAIGRKVRALLYGRTLPYRALVAETQAQGRHGTEVVRLAIKWLWEHGELVYLDLSPSLHHEHRAFALTADAFPGLALGPGAVERAHEQLVLAHVRAFGPVSVRDIAWWSGMGTVRVRGALQRRQDELVRVRVEGVPGNLVLHGDDAAELVRAEPLAPDHVALLSYEDPSLKGYFETRSRYVSAGGYDALFNSIGEARAGIMVGGSASGVWGWDRRARCVRSTLFERVPAQARNRIRDRLSDMETFLRADLPAGGYTPVRAGAAAA